MTAITYEIPLLLSSDPAAGATEISSDGSSFAIILDEGIKIPRNAIVATIRSDTQTIWNVVPNIITGYNDKLFFKIGANVYNITLSQGLYDITALQDEIERKLVAAGAPSGAVTLIGDTATQKVIIQYSTIASQMDFTQAQTPRILLGFNSRLSPVAITTVANQLDYADNTAAFNSTEYFLIHTDLVAQGIRINNAYENTICRVLIDVPPGSQITAEPKNPVKCSANNLIGGNVNKIRVWITDQTGAAINTNGEIFSASIILDYTLIQ